MTYEIHNQISIAS